MNDTQFKEICDKLDKIFAVISVQGMGDKDAKIYALKRCGFTFQEIGPLVCMKDVRKTKGWTKK